MKLLLSVSCAIDCADAVPDVFYAELTEAHIARIKQLAQAAQDLNAEEITDQFNTGSYLFGASELEDVDDTDHAISEAADALSDTKARVDVDSIMVRKHSFMFTAIPKHCGDSFMLRTASVSIAQLDDGDNVVSLG
jgi:KaiC/GvpD/RAD55 family RecA-like ATPase